MRVLAIVIVVGAFSGCTSTTSTNKPSTPTTGSVGTASMAAGTGDKIAVTQTADGNYVITTASSGSWDISFTQ